MRSTQPPRNGARRRPPARNRLAGTVLATATALGLLFGLTAPSVSPVTPATPLPVVVNAAVPAGGTTDPPTGFDQMLTRDGGNRR